MICDEGHLLKNEKTHLSIAMNRIKTKRRIVLTGTPLQNNLKEYWCMVQFIKPNLLGTYKEYLNRFVNPITNGQYTDSTQFDIVLMRKRYVLIVRLLWIKDVLWYFYTLFLMHYNSLMPLLLTVIYALFVFFISISGWGGSWFVGVVRRKIVKNVFR